MLVASSYARKIVVTCVHGAKQQNKFACHLSNLKNTNNKNIKNKRKTNNEPGSSVTLSPTSEWSCPWSQR
jgi:hypothetical protein